MREVRKERRKYKGTYEGTYAPRGHAPGRKAHWLRTDPGLENWICAGYAPGTKIWRDEPDEVARF